MSEQYLVPLISKIFCHVDPKKVYIGETADANVRRKIAIT